MKIKQIIFGFSISFLTTLMCFGQDIHFSQVNNASLQQNPANAGANNDLEAAAIFRSQWGTIGKGYQTAGGSFASRLNFRDRVESRRFNLALGFDFFSDWAGTNKVKDNHVNFHVASHVKVGNASFLGLGVYGGWKQRSLEMRNSTWASQYNGMNYDPTIPSGELFDRSSFGVFDLGTGIVYSYSTANSRIAQNDNIRLNVGVAAHHLTRPSFSFISLDTEKYYIRYSGFINGAFGIPNSHIVMEPGVYLNFQGPAREILFGTNVRYLIRDESAVTIFVNSMSAYFGLFYRNNDALIVQAGFEWNGLNFGFSYDANVLSDLMVASKGHGAFEVAVGYVIPDYTRRKYTGGGRSVF